MFYPIAFLFLSTLLHFLYIFFLVLVLVNLRQFTLLRLLSIPFIKKYIFVSFNFIPSLFLCWLLQQFRLFLLLYLYFICLNFSFFYCLFIFLFTLQRYLLFFLTYLVIGFWFFIIFPLWHIIIFFSFYLDNIENWFPLLIFPNLLNSAFIVFIQKIIILLFIFSLFYFFLQQLNFWCHFFYLLFVIFW